MHDCLCLSVCLSISVYTSVSMHNCVCLSLYLCRSVYAYVYVYVSIVCPRLCHCLFPFISVVCAWRYCYRPARAGFDRRNSTTSIATEISVVSPNEGRLTWFKLKICFTGVLCRTVRSALYKTWHGFYCKRRLRQGNVVRILPRYTFLSSPWYLVTR